MMLLIAVLLLMIAHGIHGRSSVLSKQQDNYSDVIRFPTDNVTVQASLDNIYGDNDIPESCRHKTFCTIKSNNYPDKKFNDMFKSYKIPPMPALASTVIVSNRNPNLAYEDGCKTKLTFEPLYYVKTTEDENMWRKVIQAPHHNYVQKVRLEECLTTDSCFTPLLEFNTGYETSCEQTHNEWEVLVETLDGKGTETVRSKLPVCCSCKYKDMF